MLANILGSDTLIVLVVAVVVLFGGANSRNWPGTWARRVVSSAKRNTKQGPTKEDRLPHPPQTLRRRQVSWL